jgi:methionyl-tRNA formyltransferase
MRIVLMAYQDIGWVCLDELVSLGAEIAAVVTHPDDPHEAIWFRSVAERAREAGLRVIAPASVNEPQVVRELAALRPDLILSVYFREILKPDVLRLASQAALNLHGSLLPRYRGRCPVNWVLVHGETETGVTLHHMETRPDTGDVVAQRVVPITADDTALTLNRRLGEAARALVRETFPLLVAGRAPRVPQDPARASYFGGRGPEDGRIDWDRPPRDVYNLVRAVTHPYPGAFTTFRGERLFVWQARPVAGEPGRISGAPPGGVLAVRPGEGLLVATGRDGGVLLQRVQRAGDPEERGDAFASRTGLVAGDRLGEQEERC